ncbi:hypothetical protein IGI04_039592 [Brassica rapa subsp. trilocularis]|uniref:Transcription factor MYC/MYB N-terminal domain-containing protein n=1 Tax=Brassica rapa subsp. trilocularis TaxID=1813537 RepID=A0ABQ7KNB3_BRACM|nr:hypothetical protein IGI04_039592 [Brassica rapa subsp. trilocularis]
MLMWEDGFCGGGGRSEDSARCPFGYTIMEKGGLMGKDVKLLLINVTNGYSKNHLNLNPILLITGRIPPEWTDQFESGIPTIAVIQAGHGLLQLGSCKIIQEDLHFALRMRKMVELIGYQSGLYLSQLFSSNGTAATPSSSSVPNQQLQSQASKTNYLHQQDMVSFKKAMLPPVEEQEEDIKWPNGLSSFNALTGRAEEASRHQEQNQMNIKKQNDLLSLESHHYQQERTLRHQRQPRSISNH